jgi:hypothetical protein
MTLRLHATLVGFLFACCLTHATRPHDGKTFLLAACALVGLVTLFFAAFSAKNLPTVGRR